MLEYLSELLCLNLHQAWLVAERVLQETAMPPVFGKEGTYESP
jgi:hypothetical protein